NMAVMERAKHRGAHQVGPYSRPHMLAKLDGRTREAALLRSVREELTAYVGGRPNPLQRALIERAAVLSLRVAQIDAKILGGEELGRHDNNQALAWNNALRRTLVELGVNQLEAAPAASASSLADVMAEI